jgi:hypothetical protein
MMWRGKKHRVVERRAGIQIDVRGRPTKTSEAANPTEKRGKKKRKTVSQKIVQ